jgi:hypothetical protein
MKVVAEPLNLHQSAMAKAASRGDRLNHLWIDRNRITHMPVDGSNDTQIQIVNRNVSGPNIAPTIITTTTNTTC